MKFQRFKVRAEGGYSPISCKADQIPDHSSETSNRQQAKAAHAE